MANEKDCIQRVELTEVILLIDMPLSLNPEIITHMGLYMFPFYTIKNKEVKKSLAQLKVNMECGCVRRQKGKERLQIIISE